MGNGIYSLIVAIITYCSSTILVPFCQRGTVSKQEKLKNTTHFSEVYCFGAKKGL